MNKEMRKMLAKQFALLGKTPKEIEKLIVLRDLAENKSTIKEGDRVSVNVTQIKEDVNYERKTDRYHAFIESCVGKEFTVQFDPKYLDKPSLVTLKEDQTVPKWLFWIGDLIKIKK
jgi:hypothetical protein